jgi:hypothetical protein
MTNIGIFDGATQENEVRSLTQEEIAEKDKLSAEFAAIEAAKQALAANKAAAEAKLAALGLTSDDLKALGLGGN